MGEVSAESAAGIFFEERRALLSVLHLALQTQALPPDDGVDTAVMAALCSFNDTLLAHEADGGSRMLKHIVHLIKVPPELLLVVVLLSRCST